MDVEIVGNAQENLFAGNPKEGTMLKKPIALLLENIPASEERGEPAHQHMDFLYLARPLNEEQELSLLEEEGEDMRWFTREDIEALDERKEMFSNVKMYILSVLPKGK